MGSSLARQVLASTEDGPLQPHVQHHSADTYGAHAASVIALLARIGLVVTDGSGTASRECQDAPAWKPEPGLTRRLPDLRFTRQLWRDPCPGAAVIARWRRQHPGESLLGLILEIIAGNHLCSPVGARRSRAEPHGGHLPAAQTVIFRHGSARDKEAAPRAAGRLLAESRDAPVGRKCTLAPNRRTRDPVHSLVSTRREPDRHGYFPRSV